MDDWATHQEELLRFAARQLFFVGGAPRSGTTWLQQILNAHPDISCGGEGLFMLQLASPLEKLMAQRREAIEAKNNRVFAQAGGGYPLPPPDVTEFLLGSAILLALKQQSEGRSCHAVGEKTPENVFLFPRLKRLFPGAKFIGIARDPRDVLTSAWHFFHKPANNEDGPAAKEAFVRSALPSLTEGGRMMLDLAARDPGSCVNITYEALRQNPGPVLAGLFRFLGVSDAESVVADCIAKTSFDALAAGRAAGVEQNGAFFRKGITGDWTTTLPPEINELIQRELGWMFPHFGWQP